MTAVQIRELAVQMLKKADEKTAHARTAAQAAELAKKQGSLTVGPNTFTADEMERYAKVAADEAAEWSILRIWAKELQDHSFTMKG